MLRKWGTMSLFISLLKRLVYGHFSRVNKHLALQDLCQGPYDYISPTWYGSSPAVPIWSFAAIHLFELMNIGIDYRWELLD